LLLALVQGGGAFEITGIDGKQASAPLATALAQIGSVAFLKGPATQLVPGGQVAVHLGRGQRLQGEVVAGDEKSDTVTVQTLALGVVQVKLDDLRLLSVRQGKAFPRPEQLAAAAGDSERDVIFRSTPLGFDPTIGTLHWIDREGIQFEWRGGKPELFAWDRIAGLRLENTPAAPAPAMAGPELVLLLSDGCRVRGQPGAVEGDSLALESRELGPLRVQLERVLAGHVDDSATRILLADLQPAATDERLFLPNPHLTFPFQRDANVMGDALVVNGHYWTSGLGCHSLSRLTFEVPAEAKQLVTWVGADDSSIGPEVTGDMDFRVKRGDEVVAEALAVKGGQRARPLPAIAVRPGERLTLELDFGGGTSFMRARGNWLAPMFLR
jgi:hypothetical protein